MTVDAAVGKDSGKIRSPLYPVGRDSPDPNSSCTGEGKAEKRRDPSEKAGGLGPWMRTVTRLSFVISTLMGRASWVAPHGVAPHGIAPHGVASHGIAPHGVAAGHRLGRRTA